MYGPPPPPLDSGGLFPNDGLGLAALVAATAAVPCPLKVRSCATRAPLARAPSKASNARHRTQLEIPITVCGATQVMLDELFAVLRSGRPTPQRSVAYLLSNHSPARFNARK